MKRLIFAVLALTMAAHASILLTTPYSVGGAGTSTQTATNATMTGKSANYLSNTYCVTYSVGTVTKTGSQDTGFTPMAGAPSVTNCINIVTGVMIANRSDGVQVLNTVLSGVGLTNAIAVYTGPDTALRNAADGYAASTFLPGTQPDTW